jgi:hypothetical protein
MPADLRVLREAILEGARSPVVGVPDEAYFADLRHLAVEAARGK